MPSPHHVRRQAFEGNFSKGVEFINHHVFKSMVKVIVLQAINMGWDPMNCCWKQGASHSRRSLPLAEEVCSTGEGLFALKEGTVLIEWINNQSVVCLDSITLQQDLNSSVGSELWEAVTRAIAVIWAIANSHLQCCLWNVPRTSSWHFTYGCVFNCQWYARFKKKNLLLILLTAVFY